MEERLQKIISSCGVTSRREAEKWILAGRVQVNGKVAVLGDKADLTCDVVLVDGVSLVKEERRHYVMLHKPPGYVTTLSDEKGRKTVADLVSDYGVRLWPVGRLDYQSEGLLIMTDDGDLTHKILHPSHEMEKEYLVWVRGDVEKALPILSAPMCLDGEELAPAKVTPKGNCLSVVIHQGKNRQIRRMCQQVGLEVLRLKRIREGAVSLDRKLPRGKWRDLISQEVEILKTEGNRDERKYITNY